MPCMKTLHKNNPTLYNALMYGSLYTLAEISQQTIKKYRTTPLAGNQLTHQPIVDLSSIGRFAVMGTAIMGPMFSRWYSWFRVTFVALASFVWVNVLCWIKSWPREESAPVKKTSKPEVTTSNLNIIN